MNVPFEYVIWNAQQCADYLGKDKATFLKRIQWQAGFPQRSQMEGHPRWNAKQVVEWANAGITSESRTGEAVHG